MTHKSSPLIQRLGFSLNWPIKNFYNSLYLLNVSLHSLIHYYLSRYHMNFIKYLFFMQTLSIYTYKKTLNYKILKGSLLNDLKKSEFMPSFWRNME